MRLHSKCTLGALLLAITVLGAGCSTSSSDQPLTQLQIREIQTRSFEKKEAKAVLKEMFNVLQDDAFIVKHANLELGLLSGEKDIDVENKWDRFFSVMSRGQQGVWAKNSVIEISANVTQ